MPKISWNHLIAWFLFFFQIDHQSDDRGDSADLIDEPFVNYQERMTRAMKELTRKGHDMVRGKELMKLMSRIEHNLVTNFAKIVIFCNSQNLHIFHKICSSC